MSISTTSATLRAAFQRELSRLGSRPIEGGPMVVIREGVLLAVYPDDYYPVDADLVSVLSRLPAGAGPDAVRLTLLPPPQSLSSSLAPDSGSAAGAAFHAYRPGPEEKHQS